jgi:Flp pilus assembly pilin Flp
MFGYLKTLRELKTDRRGVTMLEYAIMGSIIAAALVLAVPILTNAVSTQFHTTAGSVTGAVTAQ